jgi:hypothetical protein
VLTIARRALREEPADGDRNTPEHAGFTKQAVDLVGCGSWRLPEMASAALFTHP